MLDFCYGTACRYAYKYRNGAEYFTMKGHLFSLVIFRCANIQSFPETDKFRGNYYILLAGSCVLFVEVYYVADFTSAWGEGLYPQSAVCALVRFFYAFLPLFCGCQSLVVDLQEDCALCNANVL